MLYDNRMGVCQNLDTTLLKYLRICKVLKMREMGVCLHKLPDFFPSHADKGGIDDIEWIE